MDKLAIAEIIKNGETSTVEFKSWIKVASMKERINLAVDELVAFANAKGGTVYFGVEDNGEVTGCLGNIDSQSLLESIYDKTRPPLFVEVQEIEYESKKIIAISVESDGVIHATADGKCLKRLGKNSKPFYPDEMSNTYTSTQSFDFSSQIILDSSVEDINMLEVYNLKEKIRIRDTQSILPTMDDTAFLRDMGLIKENSGIKN